MKFLIILILLSHFAYPICQSVYESPATFSKWMKMDISNKSLKSIKKFVKNRPLDERINFYFMLFNRLDNRFTMTNDHLIVSTKRIARKKGTEQAQAYQARVSRELAEEFSPFNDLIIEDVSRELNKMGIRSEIETKYIMDGVESSAYKSLKIYPQKDLRSKTSKKLARYQRWFDIEEYTVDIFENILKDTRGFYQKATKRVELGFEGLRSVLLDDMPLQTINHEIRHAAFEAARKAERTKSIYNVNYRVIGPEGKLAPEGSSYSSYFSAEELYNWSNDPYWISERFKDIKKYVPKELIEDLNFSAGKVIDVGYIAKQTEDLSEKFVKLLKELKSDPNKKISSFLPLNKNQQPVELAEDVHHLFFDNQDFQIGMTIYIPSELRSHAKAISTHVMKYDKVLDDYMKANNLELAQGIDPAIKLQMSEKIKDEIKSNTGDSVDESHKVIIDFLIGRQEKLNLTAQKTREASLELEKYLDVFYKDFEYAKVKMGKQMLLLPAWQERFLSLRKKYAEFSRVVNEKI